MRFIFQGWNEVCFFQNLGNVVWLQRHHFAQAVCMLNTQGCNILDGIPREQYTVCLDLIRDLILGKCGVKQKKGTVEFQSCYVH